MTRFQTLYAVIFDLLGTLTRLEGEEERLLEQGIKEALAFLKEQGIRLPHAEFAEKYLEALKFAARKSSLEQEEHLATDTLTFLLQFYDYPHVEPAIVQAAVDRVFAPWVKAQRLYPGVLDVMRRLRQRGLKVGILTNAQHDRAVRQVVAHLGLQEVVDLVVTSGEVAERPRKPNPAAWEPFWQAWDMLPYEAVMVGDDLVEDILGALNAQMWTIWLKRQPAGSELERAIRPDATIARVEEVVDIIDRWEAV